MNCDGAHQTKYFSLLRFAPSIWQFPTCWALPTVSPSPSPPSMEVCIYGWLRVSYYAHNWRQLNLNFARDRHRDCESWRRPGHAFEWRQFRCTNNLNVNPRNELNEWHQTINILFAILRSKFLRMLLSIDSRRTISTSLETHSVLIVRTRTYLNFFLLPCESNLVQFTYNSKLLDLSTLLISRSKNMRCSGEALQLREQSHTTHVVVDESSTRTNWLRSNGFEMEHGQSIMNWIRNGIWDGYEWNTNARIAHTYSKNRKCVECYLWICIFRIIRWLCACSVQFLTVWNIVLCHFAVLFSFQFPFFSGRTATHPNWQLIVCVCNEYLLK